MKKNKWIKTEQMIKALKKDSDNEHEYRHWLGGILFSTHWLLYNSNKKLIGDSTNCNDYDWYSETEYLELHAGEWWHLDV